MRTTFAQLGLPKPLVRTLEQHDIVEPFPVQEATIPDALAGRDVSGKAPTGSGKTLAFGLPLLVRVEKAEKFRPRALVLAPTRELAEQIKRELTPLAKAVGRYLFAVYGGVAYGPQKGALRKGVDVLVATPGRLEDLMEQGSVDLRDVNIVVVDEADRMADMGFMPAVRRILDSTSRRRQTLLFSATLDGDIAVLSRDYQRDPVRHEAGTVEAETIDATHHFWLVERHDKIQHVADLIEATGRTIVFTRTRHGADRLARQLKNVGVSAVAMHGGRSQNQRNAALKAFASGRTHALIATDVAARGIHVDDVASVIHFDLPGDHKDYLHRSGRTARAGASGTVVSFLTREQQKGVRRMQRQLDLRVPITEPQLDAVLDGADWIEEPASGERQNDRGGRNEPRSNGRDEHTRRSSDGQGEPAQRRRKKHAGRSIYVANLPWTVTENEVQNLFGRYGRVHQTTIISDRRTGRSKGFAFVDMPDKAASAAIEALDGWSLDGRNLTVRFAKPRRFGG